MDGNGQAPRRSESRPGLFIVARSIATAPTEFVIDVFAKRKPHLEGALMPGAYAPELDRDFVMRITNGTPVRPGDFVQIWTEHRINAPLDTFYWYVPPDRRGRFVVQELSFEGRPIVLTPGVV